MITFFYTVHIVDFDGGMVGATIEKSHWIEEQWAHDHVRITMDSHFRWQGKWTPRASLIDFKENNITPRDMVGPIYVSPYLYGHYIMFVTREILQ